MPRKLVSKSVTLEIKMSPVRTRSTQVLYSTLFLAMKSLFIYFSSNFCKTALAMIRDVRTKLESVGSISMLDKDFCLHIKIIGGNWKRLAYHRHTDGHAVFYSINECRNNIR